MDWFRWHHGAVTDPKFQLIARRASATVAEVIAVWACILEEASKSDQRGVAGQIDCEATDCALGLPDGRTDAILSAMYARGILADGGVVVAWEKRQPKRERDDSSAERVREFRRKQAEQKQPITAITDNVTPCNANETQETPRGEEIRGEEKREDQKKNNSCASSGDDAPTRSDPIPYQAIVDAYNRTMTGLAKVRDLTTKRRTATRKVWTGRRQSPEFWAAYFAECQRDNFLNGTGPYRNGHENWRPDFDYLMREEVVVRTYERAISRMENGNG